MTKSSGKCMALGFLLAVTLPAFSENHSSGRAEPGLRLNVRLHDDAQVRAGTRARAEKEATRLFQQAGIEMRWLDCRLADGETAPACQGQTTCTDLDLRIVRRSKAARATFGPVALGYALPSEDGCGGRLTTVFYDRVQQEAADGDFDEGLVLGYAVAHEVAHLLLARESHAADGLMRARVRREEWQRATIGDLSFSPQQAEQLRAGVLARMRK